MYLPRFATVRTASAKLNVPAAGDLAISLFVPNTATGAGVHYSALQTSYVGPGDLTVSLPPITVP